MDMSSMLELSNTSTKRRLEHSDSMQALMDDSARLSGKVVHVTHHQSSGSKKARRQLGVLSDDEENDPNFRFRLRQSNENSSNKKCKGDSDKHSTLSTINGQLPLNAQRPSNSQRLTNTAESNFDSSTPNNLSTPHRFANSVALNSEHVAVPSVDVNSPVLNVINQAGIR